MDVHIGIRDITRELVFESDQSADEVQKAVENALVMGTPLVLDDSKGRRFVVPGAAIGYVEVGASEPRRVGFGI